MSKSKRTPYQQSMVEIVQTLLERQPEFMSYIAANRLRLKFPGIFTVDDKTKRRSWIPPIFLSKNKRDVLKKLQENNPGLEVYNSDKDRKEGDYRSGFEGLTIVIPPTKGFVLRTRRRTPKQIAICNQLMMFWSGYDEKKGIGVHPPLWIRFNQLDHADNSLYIIWPAVKKVGIWKTNKRKGVTHYKGERTIYNYKTRLSDVNMAVLLDKAEDLDCEVILADQKGEINKLFAYSSYARDGGMMAIKITP